MPRRTVSGTDLTYRLVAFDAEGRERDDDDGGLGSRAVIDQLTREPITDVFIASHGWNGDLPAAIRQYDRWIRAMAANEADLTAARLIRPGFRPMVIGLHWPSMAWGDEELDGATVSFAPVPAPGLEPLVDAYAGRIAETPAAREALATIFAAAMHHIAPSMLPADVAEAYRVLDQEAGLGSGGEEAPPGADREPFDPERSYQAALAEEAVSFGSGGLGGLLAPLRFLTFWKMKDRARSFGETGGAALLRDLQRAAGASRGVRFHLAGHSFGCIVVSAILRGSDGDRTDTSPVHSLALLQGALSLWSYCSDIPTAPGRPGYFHPVIAGGRVSGPIITTQSRWDTAVGRLYPLGAGVRGQVAFAPGELPRYGALGAYGARGPGPEVVDMEMCGAEERYRFEPGTIYNLEGSRFIREGRGLSGAHSDIDRREVAHAVWNAALS